MKIGIVTQPLRYNYGGLLQNFALQTVLKRLGHQPVTIDYFASPSVFQYIKSTVKSLLLYCLPSRRRRFIPLHPKREKAVFDDFVNSHIDKTGYVYSYRQWQIAGFDAVITGSDQVWRPIFNKDLKDMYLWFVKDPKIIKIAYAASFGTSDREYSIKEISQCKKAAELIDAVSVREQSGVELFDYYFNREAVVTLDPTLLLEADDYIRLIKEPDSRETHFLWSYILDPDSIDNEMLQRIVNNMSLDEYKKAAEGDDDMSPCKWLAMFRDAKLVVTDSFHGTVFSIIFRKPFVTINNTWRGSARIYSLLKGLGLESRIVENGSEEAIMRVAGEKIDWDLVETILNKKREFAIEFLQNSLKTRKC